MAEAERVEVRVGPQGRVVIPVALRRRLDLRDGETLIARVESDGVVLERRVAALRRPQRHHREVSNGTNTVDEVIEERRREFSGEEGRSR
ncbi:MAG: AbrB/MazE/SpoVT family DNA-binding domain-containing protein, partial [Thermoleophilaceae bacterium]